MTVKSTTAIPMKNASGIERLWSWLRDVDDALNYDPQEHLMREVADLQDKVQNLERREKQEK